MSYNLELGYPQETIKHPSGHIEIVGFEVARVHPFTGGGVVPVDPEAGKVNKALNIAAYEYGVDIFAEPSQFPLVRPVDNDGLVDASINITANYTPKIKAITGTHLSHLNGLTGAEAVPIFIQLITELKDDPDFQNYWKPTDGNIRFLAKTLLDWTFQHPDGIFLSIS